MKAWPEYYTWSAARSSKAKQQGERLGAGSAEVRVVCAPLRLFSGIARVNVNNIVAIPTLRTAEEAGVRYLRATPLTRKHPSSVGWTMVPEVKNRGLRFCVHGVVPIWLATRNSL